MQEYFSKYFTNIVGLYLHDILLDSSIYNPNNLDNTFISKIVHTQNDKTLIQSLPNSTVKILKDKFVTQPDVVFVTDYNAMVIINNVFPNSKLIYIMDNFKKHLSSHTLSKDYLKCNLKISNKFQLNQCCQLADIIVTKNKLLDNLLKKYNKNSINTEIINSFLIKLIPVSKIQRDRKIFDIVLIINDINDTMYIEFIDKLLKRTELAHLKKCIIGINNNYFTDIENLNYMGKLSYLEILKILSLSKLLLLPHHQDIVEDIVVDSYRCRCIVLTSGNVCDYSLLPNYSFCQEFDIEDWIKKTIYLVINYTELIDKYSVDYLSCDSIFRKFLKLL